MLLLMAPPPLALLLEKVLLVTLRVPPLFSMAPPPLGVELASAMVRFWTVNMTPEFTENTPTVPPPLMVITLPPSMVVLALMVFVLVTVIVAAPPQAKVTVPSKLPPPGRQVSSAASVQLALVPVPTTHASADEVAPSTAKTSGARTSTNRVRTVVVDIVCLPCCPRTSVRRCVAPSLLVEARPLAPWDRRVPARALPDLRASNVKAAGLRIAGLSDLLSFCEGTVPRGEAAPY